MAFPTADPSFPPLSHPPQRPGAARGFWGGVRRAFSTAHRVLGLDGDPAPIGPWLNRFAWTGTCLVLALAVTFFIIWRASGFFAGVRPIPLFLGWGVLHHGIGLFGPPMRVLQASIGFSGFAAVAALVTGGFRQAGVWGRAASGLVGMAGTAAAIPLVVMVGVLLFNLLLWILAIALISFALMLWVPIVLYLLLRR